MLRIHPISDLHLDHHGYRPSDASRAANVVVLAGDIWKRERGIAWARSQWPHQAIVYVMGNHEPYGMDRRQLIDTLWQEAADYEVAFMENEMAVIGGVRFLGCTLWTDFRLLGDEKHEDCLRAAEYGQLDFKLVREGGQTLNAQHTINLHNASVRWLEAQLKEEPFDGPTVVVTHHAPSLESVALRYRRDPGSACFASNLEHLFGHASLWVHGHMHQSLDYTKNGTRVLCNSRGMPHPGGGNENRDFNPDLIVEI